MGQQDNSGLTIALTGLNAVDNPGPGLGVIRALRDAYKNVRIIGLAYEALEPGIYLHDMVDKTYQIPYPTSDADELLDRIKYIHEKENLDVIIPNFDAELYNFIKIAPRLNTLGIHSFLPTHQQLEARDKANLYRFGETHQLVVPADVIAYHADDLKKAEEKFNYPMMIKGKYYDAYTVHTPDQAKKSFHYLSSKWGLPVIAQQFIKGTEINIACLADGNGETLSIVSMRKLYITEKGKAWAGITIESEDLTVVAKQFAKATGWRGSFELEVMRDTAGKLFIMEVNPRFPAWIYLSAAAGQNQPHALVKLALGEAVTPFEDYQTGKMFIRYAWDNIVDVNEFQQLTAFGEL